MGLTIAAWLFFGLLFGGMMLALVMGYLSAEERRAQEARAGKARAASAAEVATSVPAFFADLEKEAAAMAAARFDEALLASIARHVRAEKAAVSKFLLDPSVHSLYEQSDRSIHVH